MSAPICGTIGACGVTPLPLIDLLAACVVYKNDLAGVPTYALNTITYAWACRDVDVQACATKDVDAESILRLIFACDCCGNLAVNVNITDCTNPE